jgi:hypothetical protein
LCARSTHAREGGDLDRTGWATLRTCAEPPSSALIFVTKVNERLANESDLSGGRRVVDVELLEESAQVASELQALLDELDAADA